MCLGKEQKMAQVLGPSATYVGGLEEAPGHCDHLGREPANEDLFLLSFSLSQF